jgi:hypothetical protein
VAGDSELQAALDALMGRLNLASKAIVVKGALAMQTAGMGKTRVVSGTLRRSWHTEEIGAGAIYSARVGPTAIYARRIELGFRGTDSIGRHYNQAPKPYVKPAYTEALPKVEAYALAAFAAAIRG